MTLILQKKIFKWECLNMHFFPVPGKSSQNAHQTFTCRHPWRPGAEGGRLYYSIDFCRAEAFLHNGK